MDCKTQIYVYSKLISTPSKMLQGPQAIFYPKFKGIMTREWPVMSPTKFMSAPQRIGVRLRNYRALKTGP
jgi:hypothetical protein